MSKDLCCGNCKHFKDEDAEGWGTCKFSRLTKCDDKCIYHSFINNGWTEITPDNMDEVDCIPKDKVVIAWISNKEFHSFSLSCFWFTLKAMAMQGGFYYYVLPELKIDNE